MKTKLRSLNFDKRAIVELNNNKLKEINGGTSKALEISSCLCPIIFQTLTTGQED